MTMSLPTTLPPAPPGPGKATGTAAGKGLATAPGQSKDVAAGEAAGVAEMFAALVATLTAQMQPATDAAVSDGATPPTAETPADVSATALLTVLAEAGAPVDEPGVAPAPGTVAVEEAAAPAPSQATAPAVPGDAHPAPATPAVPGSADAELLLDEAVPAAPATPATPAVDTDAAATPATPATPAQPPATPAEALAAQLLAPDGTAAPVADAPAADPTVAAVPATPATPATGAADRAVAATPAAPAAPAADPHVQVARIVRPLRLGHDGAYELALDLTPAELGRVRIDVELRGATIHLSLRADNPATRELLQSSLDQLRSELEAAGLSAGQLDVGGRSASGRGTPDDHTPFAPNAVTETSADTPSSAVAGEPSITAGDTASGVDVLA